MRIATTKDKAKTVSNTAKNASQSQAKDDITERESYFSYEYNRICVGCILLRSIWTETGKDIRADTRSCVMDAVFMQDYYMRLSGL